jgi:hypothetical protein
VVVGRVVGVLFCHPASVTQARPHHATIPSGAAGYSAANA